MRLPAAQSLFVATYTDSGEGDLPPLESDPQLTDAARAHAVDMLVRDYVGHVGPDGRSAQDRVGILDFDHCGMSDPASDVGTYLATLRQLAIWQSLVARGSPASRSRSAWLRALEAQFLAEYCRASGRDESFRLLETWYEAVGLMRKALRAFARSPRSPMPLAQAEEAWRCLAELPVAARRNGRRPQ